MNPFLYNWQLSLSRPLHTDEQIIPPGFTNPGFDMHSAVHLGIVREGDFFMNVLSEKVPHPQPLELEIFLTSSWQLHGGTFSRSGTKLLLFTFLPEAVLNCVIGEDRECVRRLLYAPADRECSRFLTPEIRTAAQELAAQHETLKTAYCPDVAERKIWLKLVDFLSDTARSLRGGGPETGGKFQKIIPVFAMLGSRRHVPLSPALAAECCCLSESYFHHVFKECMGISFSLYELYFRLNGAAADLAAGAGIKQIASDWGFCDTSHFSGAFKRCFGVPPSRYRA